MAKVVNKLKEEENLLLSLVTDKSMKSREKTARISQLLLEGQITIDELIETAGSQKESNKTVLIAAMELSTKTKPAILNEKGFEFAGECLSEKAPAVKRESARVIGNTAHLFPGQLETVVPKILENTANESTVVRWSAAFALSRIMQCQTPLNKELIPAVESILKREKDTAIRKILTKY